MHRSRIVPLAWGLSGFLVCLAVALSAGDILSKVGVESAFQLAGSAIETLALAIFAIVAALIVSRQPRNTIGWLLMLPAAVLVIDTPLQSFLQRLGPLERVPSLPLWLMVWFSGWSWLLLVFPLLFIPLLFPNGRPLTRRWRRVGLATWIWAALLVLAVTFSQPMSANVTPRVVIHNPVGFLDLNSLGLVPVVGLWIAGLVALIVLCVAGLFVRYRRSGAIERQQIRWLLYAGVIFMLVYVGGGVTLIRGSEPAADTIWSVLFSLSLAGFPVAIGIAVLRYRLWDIDVLIRRTLVYSVLTALLALLYFGSVALLQAVFRAIAGQAQSEPVTVLSTLIVAGLSLPLRRRVKAMIDRRFYRRKYDAAQVLAAFGAAARDEVDLQQLSDHLLGAVDETLQPEHASLWLRDVPAVPVDKE